MVQPPPSTHLEAPLCNWPFAWRLAYPLAAPVSSRSQFACFIWCESIASAAPSRPRPPPPPAVSYFTSKLCGSFALMFYLLMQTLVREEEPAALPPSFLPSFLHEEARLPPQNRLARIRCFPSPLAEEANFLLHSTSHLVPISLPVFFTFYAGIREIFPSPDLIENKCTVLGV